MIDSQLKKEQWDFVGTAGVSVQPSGTTTTEEEKNSSEVVDHQFTAAIRNKCGYIKNKCVIDWSEETKSISLHCQLIL